MKFIAAAIVSTTAMLSTTSPLLAEEAGTGHYVPGLIASAVDKGSEATAFTVRVNGIYYSGENTQNIAVPMAGFSNLGYTVSNVDRTMERVDLGLGWRPDWGGDGPWSYSIEAILPYVSLDIEADVKNNGDGTSRRYKDSDSGLGDVIFIPVHMVYASGSLWSTDLRFAIYVPTGDFEEGKVANVGKNYWTVEPTIGFIYLNPHTGNEFDVYLGADFNKKNMDTDYQTGTQVHLESSYIKHLDVWDGTLGLGVTGYWYEQVEKDSGDAAIYGDYKSMTAGAGPVVSFDHQLNNQWALTTELKWLHEFDTTNRAEGDFVFLKGLIKY
ncbi:SphA family protein [Sinobacterium norvegicum]|nr:transporter [Sinobacterium norvegicum]